MKNNNLDHFQTLSKICIENPVFQNDNLAHFFGVKNDEENILCEERTIDRFENGLFLNHGTYFLYYRCSITDLIHNERNNIC